MHIRQDVREALNYFYDHVEINLHTNIFCTAMEWCPSDKYTHRSPGCHVDVTWMSRACNLNVTPFLATSSTYVHICWDVREDLDTQGLMKEV